MTWIDEIPDEKRRIMVRSMAKICYKCMESLDVPFDEWVSNYRDGEDRIMKVCRMCPYALEIMFVRQRGGLIGKPNTYEDAEWNNSCLTNPLKSET